MTRRPPSEDELVRFEPSRVAGGLTAVGSAYAHMKRAGYGFVDATRLLARLNQNGGFDCPGCAWPDPKDRSSFAEFCENGAKAVAEETTKARVDEAFFATHSIESLRARSDYWLGSQGRLTQPMVRYPDGTHYESIGWDAAFALVGETLRSLRDPDEAVFYTSGRTSNEAAFLYQLFARQLGTNNLPDCSNMCHESSGVALAETLGIGKGSVTLEDFDDAELILVLGQNPGTNHPRMMASLAEAKHRGTKIVAINPLPEPGLFRFAHPQKPVELLLGGTSLADVHLQVTINGDVPLLKALMVLLLEREERAPGTVVDRAFVDAHTDGFEALRDDLRRRSASDLASQAGVPLRDLERVADWIAEHRNIVACWAMGLTQHKNGVANVRELVNLLLLRGSVGRKGAGTCPVRGHSNVQGDRTMGIWERAPEAFLDRLGDVFGFVPPKHHGFDTVAAIEAMRDGRARVFVAMGGNFLAAAPDTDRTAEALARCELTVHVSTKLNRSHVVPGKAALILPCLGRSEIDVQGGAPRFVTVENSMGIVHASTGHLAPASPSLRSEPSIIAGLAEATLGSRSRIPWAWLAADYDRIRDKIEAVIPGFEEYNRRARVPGGFALPNGARERRFATTTGKARFTINAVPDLALRDGELRMMTIRSHDQFNTTIYGLEDRYRGLAGDRRVVLMHEDDMRERGFAAEDRVDVHSDYAGRRRSVFGFRVVPFPIARRCVATYFPEANVLVPLEAYADESRTPASKSVVVSVVRAAREP